jgi:hypothetical protein
MSLLWLILQFLWVGSLTFGGGLVAISLLFDVFVTSGLLTERFYYQNAKENYAINYGNTDEFLSDILLEKDFWKKVYRRMGDPLKDLFKDCPEMNSKIDIMMEKYISRDKDFEEKEKLLRKEFRKLPRDKQLDLLTIHYYDFNFIDSLISDYQNCK